MLQNAYSVAEHWVGDFDETALQGWAENLRGRLGAIHPSLGLVFMHPRYFPHAAQILEILRVHARIPLLTGCSGQSLIAGDQEIENDAGLVVSLYSLPGADLKAFHFTQEQLEECTGPAYWHQETGLTQDDTNGWLAFADPFHLNCEAWLKSWTQAYAPRPIVGGLASGDFQDRTTQLYLDGQVHDQGGVAISIGGDIQLRSVISQGCKPIGETWTITKADKNFIHEIANRPAYEVLSETFGQLSPEDQKQARGNLFIGMVTNEYLENFHRGDFLIRNVIGADPKSGVLMVGAFPRAGQTVQFQKRDAASSTEDLQQALQRAQTNLSGQSVLGGCLFSCNGRGHRLFGKHHHDASRVQKELGPFGLSGFFCNGEIGPVGEISFLHGYTASLALFVREK